MFQYIVSFNSPEGKQNIIFPIPKTVIDFAYGVDDKKYIIFTYYFDTDLEKNEYLNNLKKINSELNSNFNISIMDDESSEIINFINFNKLYSNDIQENFNLKYKSDNNNDNTKFQLHLACEIGEVNE